MNTIKTEYYTVVVEERVGERGYLTKVVMKIQPDETIDERVTVMLAYWLDDETPGKYDPETDGLYFSEHGTWVTAYTPEKISRADWLILSQHMSNM